MSFISSAETSPAFVKNLNMLTVVYWSAMALLRFPSNLISTSLG